MHIFPENISKRNREYSTYFFHLHPFFLTVKNDDFICDYDSKQVNRRYSLSQKFTNNANKYAGYIGRTASLAKIRKNLLKRDF